MAKKRKAFVHIGLDDGTGDVIALALEKHAHALLELGVRGPATSREEMFRATIEVLRAHKAWGYKRAEVQGAWAQVYRRAMKGKDTVVLSQPQLAGAEADQAALLVDGLAGFEVHVVITAHAPDAWTIPGEPAEDLGSVLERWRLAVRRPERLHVIVAADRTAAWKAFARVVGFGTASLDVSTIPVPIRNRAAHLATGPRGEVLQRLGSTWADLLLASEYDVVGDPEDLVPCRDGVEPPVELAPTEQALSEALHEIERLTRRNESLQTRLDTLEKKRAKLKRRLSEVA